MQIRSRKHPFYRGFDLEGLVGTAKCNIGIIMVNTMQQWKNTSFSSMATPRAPMAGVISKSCRMIGWSLPKQSPEAKRNKNANVPCCTSDRNTYRRSHRNIHKIIGWRGIPRNRYLHWLHVFFVGNFTSRIKTKTPASFWSTLGFVSLQFTKDCTDPVVSVLCSLRPWLAF